MNIREAHEKLATDEQCLQYIQQMRWPDGVMRCPYRQSRHRNGFQPSSCLSPYQQLASLPDWTAQSQPRTPAAVLSFSGTPVSAVPMRTMKYLRRRARRERFLSA